MSLSENSFAGSTGDSPVPSGDSPDGFRPVGRYSPEGTRTTIQIEGDALFARVRSTVPVGGSPTGAGESPPLPIYQTGSHGLLASFPAPSGKLSAITAQLVAAAEIHESRPCGNPLCIVG